MLVSDCCLTDWTDLDGAAGVTPRSAGRVERGHSISVDIVLFQVEFAQLVIQLMQQRCRIVCSLARHGIVIKLNLANLGEVVAV